MSRRSASFVSLRWRLLLPTALLVIVLAAFSVHFMTRALNSSEAALADRLAWQSAEAVQAQADDLFAALRAEAARLAYTEGVDQALLRRTTEGLPRTLDGMLRLGQADLATLLNADGRELLTMRQGDDGQSVASPNATLSANATLLDDGMLTRVMQGSAGEGLLLQTLEGVRVAVAVPVSNGQQIVGAALAGMPLARVIERLQEGSGTPIALYGADGALLGASMALTTARTGELALDARLQALAAAGSVTTTVLTLDGVRHQAAVAPLRFGQTLLGTVSVLVMESSTLATAQAQPLVAGMAAAMAVSAMGAVMVGAHRASSRLERVADVAHAIAQGHTGVRTRIMPGDEIGRVGHAVDAMANAAQQREDRLRDMLVRERREHAYLYSVLQGLPEGVLVYDAHGTLLMLNEKARRLLAGKPLSLPMSVGARSVPLARGLYTLGSPLTLARSERLLEAQVAEVAVPGGAALGRVVVLRDITDEVRRQQMHALLLDQMQHEAAQPISHTAANRSLRRAPAAREIARHAASLRKMIVDMQALTHDAPPRARARQRVIAVDTLLWAVGNDWRQIAIAANLSLQVTIQHKGLLVLGDEGRLRVALGNVVDNAIKYTPAGGLITLEIGKRTATDVHLRVRDNGVGISDDDLKQLFVPFYRGTPTDANGELLRVPGVGQGLPVARQIVEAHGGRMNVKSRVGAGTAVYLSLPLTAGVGRLPLGEPFLHEGDTVLISASDPRAQRR